MAKALSRCACACPAIRLGYATSSLETSHIVRHVATHAAAVRRTRKKSSATRDEAPVNDDGSHYLRSEAIQVTKDISACQTWEQIAQLCEHNGKLWHINIAALFSRLAYLMNAKSCSLLDGPDLQQFTIFYNRLSYTASKAMQQGMQPAEMAIIAGAVGRIGISQPWLLETLMDVSEPFLASRVCSLQHATQMAYGLAQAQQRPSDAWLAALLHCTMLTMSQAAVHAAWVSEQKHSKKPKSGRAGRGRHGSSDSKSRANKQDGSEQLEMQSRENLSRQHQSDSQGVNKKHPNTSTVSVASQHSTDDINSRRCASDARSLANLLHALACQLKVMPHTDWLHVWALATEQLIPYANAIELVQMLEGLAQVSSFHKTLHSPTSHIAHPPANSLGNGFDSTTTSESPQQVASQQSSLYEPVTMPILSIEWQRLLCNRLEKLITDISPTMAKAALRALEHLAADHRLNEDNIQAVHAMLRQACSKGYQTVADGSQAASLPISNATSLGT